MMAALDKARVSVDALPATEAAVLDALSAYTRSEYSASTEKSLTTALRNFLGEKDKTVTIDQVCALGAAVSLCTAPFRCAAPPRHAGWP